MIGASSSLGTPARCEWLSKVWVPCLKVYSCVDKFRLELHWYVCIDHDCSDSGVDILYHSFGHSIHVLCVGWRCFESNPIIWEYFPEGLIVVFPRSVVASKAPYIEGGISGLYD